MTVLLVGSVVENTATSGTTQNLTFQTMTVGNLVTVCLSCGDTGVSPLSVTSSAVSGGFTRDEFSNHTNNAGSTAIYSGIVDTAGHDDIVVTYTGAVTSLYTVMREHSGANTSSTRLDTGGSVTLTAAPYNTTTLNPSGAGELFLAVGTFNTPVNHGALVTAASNGVNTNTFTNAGILNVNDTTGFASAGTIYVETTNGLATIVYTGTTPLSFTGCTSTGTNGVLATDNRASIEQWLEVHAAAKFACSAYKIAVSGSFQQAQWGPNASNANAQISSVAYKTSEAMSASSATGTAYDSAPVSFTGSSAAPSAGTGTGASTSPKSTLGPTPTVASGTGSAHDVVFGAGNLGTSPQLGSGQANGPKSNVIPTPGFDAGVGLANRPGFTVSVNAGVASGTGSAPQSGPTTGTGVTTADPQLAAGVGAMSFPSRTVEIVTATATGSGTHPSAQTSVGPNVNLASGSGTSSTIIPGTTISTASASGRAYDAIAYAPPFVVPDVSGLTFTWSPPVGSDVPALDERDHGTVFRMFRHYGLRERGINIWQLVDGSYTIEQPYPTISVEDARRQTVPGAATYIRVFLGGHIYTDIDIPTALALDAAGFGVLGVTIIPNVADFVGLIGADGAGIIASDGSQLLWASV